MRCIRLTTVYSTTKDDKPSKFIFGKQIDIDLLAEEVKLVQVWQRGHEESLEAIDGGIIEVGQS